MDGDKRATKVAALEDKVQTMIEEQEQIWNTVVW
jgi:hypothetical protein